MAARKRDREISTRGGVHSTDRIRWKIQKRIKLERNKFSRVFNPFLFYFCNLCGLCLFPLDLPKQGNTESKRARFALLNSFPTFQRQRLLTRIIINLKFPTKESRPFFPRSDSYLFLCSIPSTMEINLSSRKFDIRNFPPSKMAK